MKKSFDKKKVKFTFSYFLVWFLLLCVLVMSALGCFAFIQLNYDSEKVNADESIIEYDNLFTSSYDNGSHEDNFYNFLVLDNSFQCLKRISITDTNFLSLNSHFTLFPGYYTFYVPEFYKSGSSAPYDSYIAFSFFDNNGNRSQTELDILEGGIFYTVNILNTTSYCSITFANRSSWNCSFSIFIWQGSWNLGNVTDSMKYQIGYSKGQLDTYQNAYDEGYSKGQLNYANSYYVKQSQAFQKAMCELYVAKQNTQSYPFLLTESGFTSFKVGGGVAYFSILDELERDLYSQGYFPQYIDITFDDDYPLVITSNSDLNLFNVANDLPVVFVTDYLDTGIYGFVTYNDRVISTVGSNWNYVVGYKISHIYIYYSYSYTNPTVVPTESTSSNINNDSYFLFDLYSATTNNLYGQGYDNGYSVGYQSGYNQGYFERGDSNFTFDNLLTSAIDVPVKAFTGLFNFELLGVNLKSFILTIFTLAIVLKITSYIL